MREKFDRVGLSGLLLKEIVANQAGRNEEEGNREDNTKITGRKEKKKKKEERRRDEYRWKRARSVGGG